MQLSTEEFLTLQGSMSRKDADNALLQREIERLTGEVKRLSDENERLRACQAGASSAVAGKPGYVLLSIDAVCNLFRNIRNVKFVSFLYLVFSKIMPPDAMQRISDVASLDAGPTLSITAEGDVNVDKLVNHGTLINSEQIESLKLN